MDRGESDATSQVPASLVTDRHFGHRRTALVDSVRAWGMVIALIVGVVLLAASLLATDRDPSRFSLLQALLFIGLPLLGLSFGFTGLYHLLLERIVFAWDRATNLAALRTQVEDEIAAAKKYRGEVRWPVLLRCRKVATRYAPTHPITGQIATLVEEATRHPWPTEAGALRREWQTVLHKVFFSAATPLDRAARLGWVLSLPLLVMSILQPVRPIGLGGAGVLLHWISLVIILRWQSGIIALGGSFLLTALVLCALSIATSFLAW